MGRGRQVIVPNATFNCNGRITNVVASMSWFGATSYPLFQVWRPILLLLGKYIKIDEVQLSAGKLIVSDQASYYFVTMSLNSSSQIEVHAGDVIGYYQPSNSCQLWNIQRSGYTSYSNTTTSPLTSIDTNIVSNIETDCQPLIKVMCGKIVNMCSVLYCPRRKLLGCNNLVYYNMV